MRSDEKIIRYLSGDMSKDEAEAFRQAMAGDKELQDGFKDYSLAWKLMGERLREKDEEAFRDKLKALMDKRESGGQTALKSRKWLFTIPAAAAILLLALLLFNEGDNSRLYQLYCQPSEDALVGAMLAETRGQVDEQLMLYRDGRHGESMARGITLLEGDRNDVRTLLFTLLSALEISAQEEVLPLLQKLKHETDYPLGQALCWYHAMALLKSGDKEACAHLLTRLEEEKGPYEKAAHKLRQRMKK